MKCTQEDYDAMTEGTCIQVSGYKAEWSGEIEIMDGQLDQIVGGRHLCGPSPWTPPSCWALTSWSSIRTRKSPSPGPDCGSQHRRQRQRGCFPVQLPMAPALRATTCTSTFPTTTQTFSFVVESYLCDSSTEVYKAVEGFGGWTDH